MVDPGGVASDVAVAEILGNAGHHQQLNLIAGSKRSQICLVTLQINLSVWRDADGFSGWKKKLPTRRVGSGKIHLYRRILERLRNVRQSVGGETRSEWQRPGEEIILPQVGK